MQGQEMNLAVSESDEVNPGRRRARTLAHLPKTVSLEVNDLLQIQFPEDPQSLSCRSRVDDIVQDRIQIAWPTDHGVLMPIGRNQTLTISFVRDDAVYAFNGIVEELVRAPRPTLLIASVGQPERIQRRQFFRVKAYLPIELVGEQVCYVDDNPVTKAIAIRSLTCEISGSGLAIRHDKSIAPGTLLDCKLMVPRERKPLAILCKVVHSSPVGSCDDTTQYHIGMYFLSIREADRTRIVRHVFRVEVG